MRRQASSHRAHRRRGIPGGRGVRGSRSGAGIGFIVVEVGVERDGRRRAPRRSRVRRRRGRAPLAIELRPDRRRAGGVHEAARRVRARPRSHGRVHDDQPRARPRRGGHRGGVDAEAYLVRVLHGRGASNVASMDRVAASRRGDDYREAGRGLGRRGSRFGGGGGGGERDAGFARGAGPRTRGGSREGGEKRRTRRRVKIRVVVTPASREAEAREEGRRARRRRRRGAPGVARDQRFRRRDRRR